MKCPQCKSEVGDDSKFCKECGTSITSAEYAQPSFTKTLETPVEALTRGTLFADRYEIIEELGKGGMGAVYRVEDTKAKEEIALKLIKPEIASDRKTIERFRNELTTARKIRHKNICGMYDLNEENGTHYITMEYVPGEDLKSFLRRSRQIAIKTAVEIGQQICEGLSEAHRLGVVHRDLKPSNIMIDKEGNARIMDFGIARIVKAKGITGEGVMIGTPEYMSPEQAEAKDVDHRSDLYSLGVILYEMVTGKMPFEGDTPLAIAMKHKGESPTDPQVINAQIPDDLNKVILRCLEKNKESRYQSAAELKSELYDIGVGAPVTELTAAGKKTQTSKEITLQFSPRKLLLPALILGALAIAIVMVIWQPWSQKAIYAAPRIKDSIAVISFKNQTGDPAYDYLQGVIPNLLITNLENTGLFHVATWERLQDILKQIDVKQTEFIDSDLGYELCQKAGYEAIAIGTFSKAGDVFIMDVKVLDAETKRTLKSTNTKGTGAESIFDSQIDELSREISLGLGAGLDKVEAARLNIKDITTHSLEAYKYFLKGKEDCNLHAWGQARENLQKALELDSAFAMAYVYLAWTYIDPGPAQAISETIEKAMAFSDKTSQKDRLYLDGLNAYFVEQDSKKAIAFLDELIQKYPDEKWAFHMQGDFLRNDDDLDRAYARYKRWLELDPQDPNALYHLSNVSAMMGDSGKVEEYIKKHEAIAPPDAANKTFQAISYEKIGQLDKAIEKRKEILEIRPDLRGNFRLISELYCLQEEYEEALKWANEYVSLASSPGQKIMSHYNRGYTHFFRGAFNEALADFTQSALMAEEADRLEDKGYALDGKGLVYLVRGDYESCRQTFENMPMDPLAEDPDLTLIYRADRLFDLAMLSLEQGQTGPAEVKLSEIDMLKPDVSFDKSYINIIRDLLQGEVLLVQGALDEALSAGKMACGPESPNWRRGPSIFGPPAYYMDLLARIYAKRGDIGQAISEYERLFKVNYSTALTFDIYPLYHYRLGLLCEKANETAKAAAQYEKFLDLWKDADPNLPEVTDARVRVAALMQH